MKRVIQGLAALAGAAAIAAPGAAGATIFFGTYTPSDTAVTQKQTFLPLDYRSPDASQTFDTAASVSVTCANFFCSYFVQTQVTTDFVAPTTFDATNLIVPVAVSSPYGNRRVGFDVQHYNAASSAWEGMGFMQIESGLLPQGVIREVDAPFGNAGARFIDFSHLNLHFVAGDSYRISAHHAAGAAGSMAWYLSDEAAVGAQSRQYSSLSGTSNLAYQPAFAFTDGGALTYPSPPTPTVSGAPEPAAWGLMFLGFLGVGAALRAPRRYPQSGEASQT